MKVLNSTGPSTDAWKAQLVTSLHLDIQMLTTTFWMQPPSQSLIHWLSPTNLQGYVYFKLGSLSVIDAAVLTAEEWWYGHEYALSRVSLAADEAECMQSEPEW